MAGPRSASSTRTTDAVAAFVDRAWEEEIVPALVEYVRIPNRSPAFDPRWRESGHMERAVELVSAWCAARLPERAELEVVRLEGRTPLLLIDVPARGAAGADGDTVLLYGHLDKQPEMRGWREGLGPWKPVIEGDRLYGRGAADDGYAAFASLTALRALAAVDVPHARAVVLIEASEESGSTDLAAYVEHLRGRIGRPSLVVCLDSGCGDYERLWHTTSLRGLVTAHLHVEVLREGVHSGDAGGIVPDTFRLARALLSRLEDEASGRILLEECHVEVPRQRIEEARAAAAVLGDAVWTKFPFVAGARPAQGDGAELVLARTWRPSLAVTGAGGLPALADAGNVLRPSTSLALSLRLPPAADAARVARRLAELLERDPPSGARVELRIESAASGWNAPPLAPWLAAAVDEASRAAFGAPPAQMGEGGSIPFMGMLGERFPEAQFLITGVLGPGSNAHGPNEFLHVPTGRRLTAAVAAVVAAHARR